MHSYIPNLTAPVIPIPDQLCFPWSHLLRPYKMMQPQINGNYMELYPATCGHLIDSCPASHEMNETLPLGL